MKSKILFITFLMFTAMSAHAAPSCYTGELMVPAADGKFKLKIEIKNNELNTTILNPDDILHAGGKTKKVSEVFDPGNPTKLVPLEGVKCPCDAIRSESGKFTLIVEHLGDGTDRTTINFFGMNAQVVKLEPCHAPAAPANVAPPAPQVIR